MSKVDLKILAQIFSDMNDYINQLVPSNSWMSDPLRGYLFLYRDELIKRILAKSDLCFKKYKDFKSVDFEKIAKS